MRDRRLLRPRLLVPSCGLEMCLAEYPVHLWNSLINACSFVSARQKLSHASH